MALILLPNETAYAQYQFSYQDTEQRVNSIVDAMTLEQKIGQMIQGNIKHVTPADVSKYYLGAVLNGGEHWLAGNQSSVGDWLRLADAYYEASIDKTQGGAGIPIIWGSDTVNGFLQCICSEIIFLVGCLHALRHKASADFPQG